MANHSFDIYRKMSLMLSEGIHLADILDFMGIESIYIYGAGEIGKMVLSDLSGRMKALAVFDQAAENNAFIDIYKSGQKYTYPLYSPARIPDDDTIILVTPASMYSEIIAILIERGISKYRFLSLNLLLYYGMYYREELKKGARENKFNHMQRKQFLITGAQFSNKGSQSMLFVAMSEIRKRFRDALIWYCPNFDDDEYKKESCKYRIMILRDGTDKTSTLYEVMPWLDGLVDVSGYALSSCISINAIDREMNYLRMAQEYQIPVYMMPQSFGPFDLKKEQCEEIRGLLSYVKVIYAREQSGYDLLINKFALTNVKRSKDLVLQNKEINLKDVYVYTDDNMQFCLPTMNNVAVIPNIQNYRNGEPKKVLQIYKAAVDKLLLLEKEIYIVSHSEDEYICEDIYEPYMEEARVHLYREKFDCMGFIELVKNFQYIIGSRFHAVVHAYKMQVPCIVVGWAEKYKELLETFRQERYLFDVRESINIQEFLDTVEIMENSFVEEAKKIAEVLPDMQTENCFDILDLRKG